MTDDDLQQIVDDYKGRARADLFEGSSTKQLENRCVVYSSSDNRKHSDVAWSVCIHHR